MNHAQQHSETVLLLRYTSGTTIICHTKDDISSGWKTLHCLSPFVMMTIMTPNGPALNMGVLPGVKSDAGFIAQEQHVEMLLTEDQLDPNLVAKYADAVNLRRIITPERTLQIVK